MSVKKVLVRAVAGFAIVSVALVGGTLAFTKLEINKSGVHTRLMVPLLGLATAKVAVHAGTGDSVAIPGFLDGPVIKRSADGDAWHAAWFCQDRVHRQQGTGPALSIDCAGTSRTFAVAAPSPMAAGVTPMPEKLLILSDIEGNIAYLEGALRRLDAVDTNGNWSFGANRIVIAGDAVDRGRDVFAVLWRLHDLSLQARAAGGRLDLLIGNHEQYILRGNTSRAHLDHIYALERLGGVDAAFAPDTVIGAWLRAQPVIVKVGEVLVTHGGISPTVARQGVTVDQLNAAIGRYWRKEPADKSALDAVFGMHGIAQYRGYLIDLPEYYPVATSTDVDRALQAFGVKTIVVAHTIVEKVTGLYDNRVYAVDVNSNTAANEALMFVGSVATVVDTGTPRALPDEKERGSLRRLDLLGADDWNTLSRVVNRSYQLSRLPHPY